MVSWFSGSWTLPTSIPQCSLSLRYRWYAWNGPMGDGHPRVFYSLYFEQVCISAVTSSGCEKRLYGEGRSKGRGHAYLRSPWLPAVVPSRCTKADFDFSEQPVLSLGSAIPASLPAGRSYYTYVSTGLALHVMLMKPEFVKYSLIPLEEDCFKKKRPQYK